MNANYIYDIFQTCEELDLPDLDHCPGPPPGRATPSQRV